MKTDTDNPNQDLDDLITHAERKRNVLNGIAAILAMAFLYTIAEGPSSVMISVLDVVWVISITWLQLACVVLAVIFCLGAHSASLNAEHLRGVSRKDG